MSALAAVMVREGKIRATNTIFIFWDLVYPLGYLLVFSIGVSRSMGFTTGLATVRYSDFFLAGVLGMASFGIASNTAWSFFLDRDNGIFYEMLTYPLSRPQYLVGKVLFNVLVALVQSLLTVVLASLFLHVDLQIGRVPLLIAATIVGTAGWFFFYAIFALRIRRNDAFNTVTSVFYFFFLFASSMFYPIRTPSGTGSHAGAGEPDHLARRCPAVRHDRGRRCAHRGHGGCSLRGLHAGRIRSRGALPRA
jgi:ABC-2 type transport system permease protein